MKVLYLVFHPDLTKSKVNSTWTQAARESGFTVKDMYSLYPNFKFDVEREQRDLLEHDRIVLQFPFYWYSSPALLKQWLDDVLTFGFAYGPKEMLKLAGKDLVLSVSVGGPQDSYVPGGYNNFTVPELLRPFQQTAFLCRLNYCTPFWMHSSVIATPEIAKDYGKKMVQHLTDPSISDIWSVQKRIFKSMGIS